MVLDYSQFVEIAYEESDGCIYYAPSVADVLRYAPQFIDPDEAPEDPLAVTLDEQQLAYDRWMCFKLMRQDTFGEWYHVSKCPHCETEVEFSIQPPHLPSDVLTELSLRRCLICGWWDMEETAKTRQDEDSRHYEAPSVHRRAVLREFDIAGSNIPINSLRDYLARHPNALSSISPHALEVLVGDVFGETMDCEAVHVGGPNDGGIDIILVQGAKRFVVQTKRRAGTTAESVSAIREFIGAMVVAGEVRGIFVTTAPRFSKCAVVSAESAVRRGAVEYIDLVTPKKLIDACKLAARDADEHWQKVRSTLPQLHLHINPGHSAFLELFMGRPDWRMASRNEDLHSRKARAPLRYFISDLPSDRA